MFAHIPKAAGSSVYLWFLDDGWLISNLGLQESAGIGLDLKEKFNILQCQIEGPLSNESSVQHSVVSTYRQWGDFTSGFCIVRHPWSRFVSEIRYAFTLACEQSSVSNPTESIAMRFIQDYMLKVFNAFPECKNIRDNHIRPQTDFISEITEVYYLERDWKEQLQAKYDLKGLPPTANKTVLPFDFEPLLDDNIRNMVLDFYHEDFELLDYEKTIPK
ncbi:sulfotransferase family 2 domain-containing protein [Desulfonatronovibrio magnus]|uniref:sulfotransferase family 2 domain-containing protein n=1 Tax=Desulfonatronovibrio magnus TaxID=698827 RepID=UPI0005EB4374|nr:sulfotransferase family 2 domain-containing protein [Desulfonatronovibrio magnus]